MHRLHQTLLDLLVGDRLGFPDVLCPLELVTVHLHSLLHNQDLGLPVDVVIYEEWLEVGLVEVLEFRLFLLFLDQRDLGLKLCGFNGQSLPLLYPLGLRETALDVERHGCPKDNSRNQHHDQCPTLDDLHLLLVSFEDWDSQDEREGHRSSDESSIPHNPQLEEIHLPFLPHYQVEQPGHNEHAREST